MINIEPILIFTGQANEALETYVKAFNAELVVKMHFSDADPKDWECKEEEKDLIYHSQIKIGNQILMIADDADAIKDGVVKASGNSFAIDLLINFDSDEELKKAYDVLCDGATITSPLCSTTYCSLTCALVDKFGGRWQLMSGFKG